MCKNGYVYNIEVEDNNNYFVDNILVHNCHHSAAKTYKEIINYFTPNKLLGFSATPNRGDKVRLDNIFDEIIFERPLKWGILNNFLCGIECKSIDIGYDLTNIKTSKGDYQQKELESTVNIDSANEVIAEAYLKYAKGQTVIFGVSVNHCYEIQKLIKDSQVVDGKTNKEKRKQLIEDFTNRKFNCLINCLVFTEGTDMPLIETIIIARPTQNESLYTQMVGRGLRLYEGKNKLLLIDCVGASNNDLCVAPTLFGLNIHETNMTVNEIEGDLFDLSDFIMDEIENPKTWIKNIKNINIFKKKSGYDMHNVNYFLKPDGSFTLSFPGFNKTIPAADKLGYIQAKNGKMKLQDAFDIMYNYLVKNHQEKSQLWDLNKIKQWGKHRATEQQLYLIEKYYPDYPAYLLNKMEAFILINKAKGAY